MERNIRSGCKCIELRIHYHRVIKNLPCSFPTCRNENQMFVAVFPLKRPCISCSCSVSNNGQSNHTRSYNVHVNVIINIHFLIFFKIIVNFWINKCRAFHQDRGILDKYHLDKYSTKDMGTQKRYQHSGLVVKLPTKETFETVTITEVFNVALSHHESLKQSDVIT